MNKKRKAAIKNILKFNKTKFNYNKFVRDFYLEKNTAYVSVNIDNYNDVISKYSISNYEWLNPEFASYVEETAYYIPIQYDIALDINGNFTKEQEEVIKKTIKSYFGIKLGDAQNDLDTNKLLNMLLFVVAVLFLIIFFVVTFYIPSFKFLEPISIISWFIMWELLDNNFIKRQQLRAKKIDLAQLVNMEIKFNEDVTRKREVN
jgi:hypothetical protein